MTNIREICEFLKGLLNNPLVDDYLISEDGHELPFLEPTAVQHVDEYLYKQLQSLIDNQHVLDYILLREQIITNDSVSRELQSVGFALWAKSAESLYLRCHKFSIRLV